MTIHTAQERLQKFDEIIEHFAQDSRRRTTGSVIQKNICEPDGRRSAGGMLFSREEAVLIQSLISAASRFKSNDNLIETVRAIQKKSNEKWGMCMPFILDMIHDDDRCWDASTSKLSQSGHLVVEAYRHLFVVDCLPNDEEFRNLGGEIIKANNMFDFMLKWARELKEAHPIVNHELGNT